MKKTISFFYFLLIIFFVASCDKKSETNSKESNSTDTLNAEIDGDLSSIPFKYGKTDSLLWRISGNGLSKPSYLFGTVHLIPKDDFFVSKDMLMKFKEADQLVLEIDMGNFNPFDLTNMDGLSLPEGVSLETLLSKEDYKFLETFFSDSLGMSLSLLNKSNLKPIFLSSLITETGLSGETESYEMTLTAWAKMHKKEILGLETLEFQFSIFDSIPYNKQAEMLMEGVRSYGASKNELDELYEYYKSNELSKLVSLSNNSASDLMEFEEILLNKRNIKWIPLIEKYSKEKSTFFAVGALHLPGEKGVINLLRKQGYRVEPVSKTSMFVK